MTSGFFIIFDSSGRLKYINNIGRSLLFKRESDFVENFFLIQDLFFLESLDGRESIPSILAWEKDSDGVLCLPNDMKQFLFHTRYSLFFSCEINGVWRFSLQKNQQILECVVWFSPTHSLLSYSYTLQSEGIFSSSLDYALARKDFFIELQPKIHLTDKSLLGYEALIRWKSEAFGIVMPNRFLPLAEKRGYLAKIDFWVVEQVVQFLSKILTKLGSRFCQPIAVNISEAEFYHHKFATFVSSLVKEYSIPSRFLQFEITENVIVHDFTDSLQIIQFLRQKGFSIFLDDFGTGNSNLVYLKYFSFDAIKVDRVFIKDLPGSKRDLSLFQSIVDLGNRLDLEVLIEGIENISQANIAIASGCYSAQGYLYGKPKSLQEIWYDICTCHE